MLSYPLRILTVAIGVRTDQKLQETSYQVDQARTHQDAYLSVIKSGPLPAVFS